jgi:hypothetical protein
MKNAVSQTMTDRTEIRRWKPIIHKPTDKIFIACDRLTVPQGFILTDHYGNQYPYSDCEVFPMCYGNRLQECWERSKPIAWQDCPLKVGDLVSPIYGKQAGQKFAVELFDHSDRTVGIGNFQHWYYLEHLSFDGKELQSFAGAVSEPFQKWEAIASISSDLPIAKSGTISS